MNNILDENGCFQEINLVIDGEMVGIGGMTEDQAFIQFGNANFKAALQRHFSIKLPKLILINRLSDARLFEKAIRIIKKDDLMYERWQASTFVETGNADVRKLLKAIGGDLNVLLAPEA